MKIWKKINNFPDYEINNFGEVRSFKLCKNGRILNNLISKEYFSVSLYKDKKGFIKKIHRLVLETFNPIDNIENLQVNHKNGIKTESKLMEKNIIEIFRLLKSGLKIKEISEIFSVSPSTICDIKMKRTWLHIKGVE